MFLDRFFSSVLPDPYKYPPLSLTASLIGFARFLSLFRIFVIGLMLMMMLLDIGHFGLYNPLSFFGLSLVYLIFASTIFIMRRQDTLQTNEQLAHSVLDITFLSTLEGLSGGMQSGMTILTLIIMGLGSGLCTHIGWKFLALWAIVATILSELIRVQEFGHDALLKSTFEKLKTSEDFVIVSTSESYLPILFIGIAYIVSGAVANRIGYRMRHYDQEQKEKQLHLELQLRINALMMKEMDEGILLVNHHGAIQQMNRKAQTMLFLEPNIQSANLRELSLRLLDHYQQWQNHRGIAECDFRIAQSRNLLFARFLSVPLEQKMSVILIQDKEQVQLQAQKLKLAALGLLTANIAHEIRNPLSAILQSAELLQDEAKEQNSIQPLTHIILEHSRRIDHIIHDITKLGQRDRVKKEKYFLLPIFNDMVHQFIELHRQSEENVDNIIRLDIPSTIMIEFDQEHFRQIITNLLNNAWYYCQRKHSSIRIYTQFDPSIQEVKIHMIDDGPGIAANLASKIFEPFFTTRSTGSGLGLYVCRELVESNNGKLFLLDNAPGAYFCITAHGSINNTL